MKYNLKQSRKPERTKLLLFFLMNSIFDKSSGIHTKKVETRLKLVISGMKRGDIATDLTDKKR